MNNSGVFDIARKITLHIQFFLVAQFPGWILVCGVVSRSTQDFSLAILIESEKYILSSFQQLSGLSGWNLWKILLTFRKSCCYAPISAFHHGARGLLFPRWRFGKQWFAACVIYLVKCSISASALANEEGGWKLVARMIESNLYLIYLLPICDWDVGLIDALCWRRALYIY